MDYKRDCTYRYIIFAIDDSNWRLPVASPAPTRPSSVPTQEERKKERKREREREYVCVCEVYFFQPTQLTPIFLVSNILVCLSYLPYVLVSCCWPSRSFLLFFSNRIPAHSSPAPCFALRFFSWIDLQMAKIPWPDLEPWNLLPVSSDISTTTSTASLRYVLKLRTSDLLLIFPLGGAKTKKKPQTTFISPTAQLYLVRAEGQCHKPSLLHRTIIIIIITTIICRYGTYFACT